MAGKNKTIIILIAVWAAIITYAFFSWRSAPVAARPQGAAAEQGEARVRLDLLKAKGTGTKEATRDIFSPIRAPYVPPVKPAPAPAPPSAPAPPAPPPPKVATPLETFTSAVRFMGHVERGNATTVFLSKGEDVFLVRKGELLEKRFRVKDISPEKITLVDETTKEESAIVINR